MRHVFEKVGCYVTVVPTYVGGFMALVWSSKKACLGQITLSDLQERFVSQTLGKRIAAIIRLFIWDLSPCQDGYRGW